MNLLCFKIWSGRNVPWLLKYNVTWSDFRIDKVWERKWTEKRDRKKKHIKKRRKERKDYSDLILINDTHSFFFFKK